MQKTSQLERQSLGCGYEPRTDRVHLTIWQPPERFYSGPPLTVCAGYTANLPEVIEVAMTRPHWKFGAVVAACDGETPTEEMRNALLILDSSTSELEGWLMTPAKDGGGGA